MPKPKIEKFAVTARMTWDINIKIPAPGRKAVKAGWRISPGFLRRIKAIAYQESPDWPIDSLETAESVVIAMIKLSNEIHQGGIESLPADPHDDDLTSVIRNSGD